MPPQASRPTRQASKGTLYGDSVTTVTAADNEYKLFLDGGSKVTSIVGGKKDDTLTTTNTNATLDGGDGADIVGGACADTLTGKAPRSTAARTMTA